VRYLLEDASVKVCIAVHFAWHSNKMGRC
jgi:hypothetical protein